MLFLTGWLAGKRRRPAVGLMKGGRRGVFEKIPAATYSPTRKPCSTIGSGGLNFRVRDGNGWNPSDVATGNLFGGSTRRLERLADVAHRKLLLAGAGWAPGRAAYAQVSGVVSRCETALDPGLRKDEGWSKEEKNDQAARAISIGQLNALLRLHLRPINVVVFDGSSGGCPREA